MSWKEFDFRTDSVADRLPWGGLIRPSVMRNKDDSFFGIIQYNSYANGSIKIELPDFINGWAFWIEHQCIKKLHKDFFILAWNPFFDTNREIYNTLHHQNIAFKEAKVYFEDVLNDMAARMAKVTFCHVLEYQEILDVLSFSLSFGLHSVKMPDTPLYLDALLSQDISLDFTQNQIRMDQQWILAASLPGIATDVEMTVIYRALEENIPYRHVQRLLHFGEKDALEELNWYTASWCPGRKKIKSMMTNGLLNKINGYHMDTIFLLLPDKEHFLQTRQYLEHMLCAAELPYIIEDYNFKDVWWGSLAGCFRANITPPVMGFSALDELLVHYDPGRKDRESYV